MLSGVSKTAVLTLRARADEHKKRDRLFADPLAVEWYAKMTWPADLSHWYTDWVQTKLVFRVDQIDLLLRMRMAEVPGATVVELGCGLSSRFQRVGGAASWIDLDLPQMIEARTSLGIAAPKLRHLAASVLDFGWFSEISEPDARKIIFIAEGLFYYLPRAELDRLLLEMRRRFSGATIIFDVIGAADLKPSVAASSIAGTPILWAVEPPFERAMEAFGVEILPGFEPEWVMEEMFDRFRRRFGPAMKFIIKNLARVPRFRNRRSGIMVGRLASLQS